MAGIRPLLPFPFGNHDPPKTGTLLVGRVVGGVFPIETFPPGRFDSPGNFDVWLFPKFGFNVGFVMVPNPRSFEGLLVLTEPDPLPNDGLAGLNFPKPPVLREAELLPVREGVPNLLTLGFEPEKIRLPLLRDELEEKFRLPEKLRDEPFELFPNRNCA